MTLPFAIVRLRAWEKKLSNIQAFYHLHKEGWRDLAHQVAVSTFSALAPDDSRDWQRTVEVAAERISLVMLPIFDAYGVAIYLDRTQKTHFDDAFAVLFAGELSLEEIILYVAAGRRGDPWGKQDFSEEDRAKEDWQIAENILESIRSGDSRVREALIKAFLNRRLGEELAERLPAVLAAWKEAFTVRAHADWRKWWKGN